ncbi:MAG: beta-ketoacyl-[acyl-carrier-protein] synthase family protein [Gemmataceae bacterium]
MASRRTVFTGLGIFSPLGLNVASLWDGMTAGKSGIRPISAFDASSFAVKFGGELPAFDAKTFFEKKDRKSLKMMARPIQIGVGCANLTMADTGIDRSKLDPTRFGCEFGSSLIPTEVDDLVPAGNVSYHGVPGEIDLRRWGTEAIPSMPPLWMLKFLPNMVACHVSIMHDAQGPNNSITETDAAGLLAIGEAYHILRRDQADFFLCGASDSKLNILSVARHCMFSKLSKRNDDPAGASRPFDKARDGWVLAEGAGVLALEELEHAKRRNAKIYGELAGFGSAFDRNLDGTGIARAIKTAMSQANVSPSDVDHVNAHGDSTVENDAWEARGIHAVFGNEVPVFAAKSYLGNMSSAGGPVELAASLLALQHGTLPATLNYNEADPSCPVRVLREPRKVTKPYAVKISLTEMGQVAAAVIRKWE